MNEDDKRLLNQVAGGLEEDGRPHTARKLRELAERIGQPPKAEFQPDWSKAPYNAIAFRGVWSNVVRHDASMLDGEFYISRPESKLPSDAELAKMADMLLGSDLVKWLGTLPDENKWGLLKAFERKDGE